MIKHIVLFKLQEFASLEEKDRKMQEIKSALETLPSIITEVKSLSVGITCNPNESHDIALETSFNSLEDLDIYAKHPDHVAVVKIIKPVVVNRACVDYEF